MNIRVVLLVLFVLGANWLCDARQLSNPYVSEMQITYDTQEVEIIPTVKEGSRNDKLCTLCEEYAAQALEYISQNKTQTEIIEILHQTCSQLHAYKQQCFTLVDYYAPLFFSEISNIQAGDFCRKVNLCQQVVMISSQLREDSCGLCHRAVSEVLVKLKDPDTQLEIIEILLKACDSMKDYEKKCKRLVFQYGPLILVNAEQFLEKTDICVALHACNSTTISSSWDAAKVAVADS
ncbi:hypothetical protein UlMin_000830 [Ulmus minor]